MCYVAADKCLNVLKVVLKHKVHYSVLYTGWR
jgi:hypothetical protein